MNGRVRLYRWFVRDAEAEGHPNPLCEGPPLPVVWHSVGLRDPALSARMRAGWCGMNARQSAEKDAPSEGQERCSTCGKTVWLVIHSCKGVSAENDVLHLTALLSAHHLEVEPRAYPSYACSCESWHGAMGDDGGESDGLHDNENGWATHVAERLIAVGYQRVIPPGSGDAS